MSKAGVLKFRTRMCDVRRGVDKLFVFDELMRVDIFGVSAFSAARASSEIRGNAEVVDDCASVGSAAAADF